MCARTTLNGDWKLFYCHQKDLPETTLQTVAELAKSGLPGVPARVPGNFELDLQRAGVLPDVFFGLNVLKTQDYEDCTVWYTRDFDWAGPVTGREELVFEGLDTFAEVFLNGEFQGSSENALIPHRFPAGALRQGQNELVVRLSPAALAARHIPVAAGQIALRYNYDALYVRKPASAYGWDIMPRTVSCGLWRDVAIEDRGESFLEEAYLYVASLRPGMAHLQLFYRFELPDGEDCRDFLVRAEGRCGDSAFRAEQKPFFNAGNLAFSLPNPRLWWPKGRGEQNLYDVSVTLWKGEKRLDERRFRTGVRTVDLRRTSTTDAFGKGEFCFFVNGERVFINGTNWVPADAFHSRDRERIPRMLQLADEVGVNAIRCWGGNVYEDDLFFDICDEKGFLVWQDFAMACALYPQDDWFAEAIRDEAAKVVQRLRGHACLLLWSGDNENDVMFPVLGLRRDPNRNRLTREVLPRVLQEHDPARPYLPSSPYIDEVAFRTGEPTPEQHLWGPRDYYKSSFYKESTAHFASEMGYHGCNSPESIRKFLPEDMLWPWQGNEGWLVHAAGAETGMNTPYSYRIELMAKQIRELFGFDPQDLETFSRASQINQAEAFKFFVELFRCQKWRRTGLIWWNLIDGWPQFSDAVVDYYFEKKLAFGYLQRSSRPLILAFAEPESWSLALTACSDLRFDVPLCYTVTDAETGEVLLRGEGVAKADAATPLGTLPYSQGKRALYILRWQAGEHSGCNHYLCGNPPFSLADYTRWMRAFEEAECSI